MFKVATGNGGKQAFLQVMRGGQQAATTRRIIQSKLIFSHQSYLFPGSTLYPQQMAFFASSNNKPPANTDGDATTAAASDVDKKKTVKKGSKAKLTVEENTVTPKKRASSASKDKKDAGETAPAKESKSSRKKKETTAAAEETKEDVPPPPVLHKLYTLKFNSPILPFAKFPLTQNKYIQDFLRKYEEDKEHVTKIIGVHFPQNNNSMASDAIGIEIEISKKNNITVVESNSQKRFRIKSYDEATNFCMAEEYQDVPQIKKEGATGK